MSIEAKNCFRTKWVQSPLYNGGTVSNLIVNKVKAGTEAIGNLTFLKDNCNESYSEAEFLVVACGEDINLVDSLNGKCAASYSFPDDDIVINLDSVYVPNLNLEVPFKDFKNTSAEKSSTSAPPGSYLVASTRNLQIVVFEVIQITDTLHQIDENGNENNKFVYTDGFSLKIVQQWTASDSHAISSVYFSKNYNNIFLPTEVDGIHIQNFYNSQICNMNGKFLATGTTVGAIKVWNVFHHHFLGNFIHPHGGVITHISMSTYAGKDANFLDNFPLYLIAGNAEGGVAIFVVNTDAKGQTNKACVAVSKLHASSVVAIHASIEDVTGTEGLANHKVLRLFTVGRDRKVVTSFFKIPKTSKEALPATQALQVYRAVAITEYVSCASFVSVGSGQKDLMLYVGTTNGSVSIYSVERCRIDQTFLADIKSSSNINGNMSIISQSPRGERLYNPEDVNDECFINSITLSSIGLTNHYFTLSAAIDSLFSCQHYVNSLKPCTEHIIEDITSTADEEKNKSTICALTKLSNHHAQVSAYVADSSYCIRCFKGTEKNSFERPAYTIVAFLDQILDIKLLDFNTLIKDYNDDQINKKSSNMYKADGFKWLSNDLLKGMLPLSEICPRVVVTNSKDVRIFTTKGNSSVFSLQGHNDIVMCAAIYQTSELDINICSPKDENNFINVRSAGIIATGAKDGVIRLWDVSTMRCFAVGGAEFNNSSSLHALKYTEDITALSFIGNVSPSDTGKSTSPWRFEYSNGSKSFNPANNTGLFLTSTSSDESILLWDIGSVYIRWLVDLVLAQDKDITADMQVLKPIHRINNIHNGPVHCMASNKEFNRCVGSTSLSLVSGGALVATGGKDKILNLWRVNVKKLVSCKFFSEAAEEKYDSEKKASVGFLAKEAALKGHRRAINSVAFSPTDNLVMSSSNDGTIRLWSLNSFSCVKTLQNNVSETVDGSVFSSSCVLSAAFFNNGYQCVSAGSTGIVSVWSISTGEVLTTVKVGEFKDTLKESSYEKREIRGEKVWALAVIEEDDKSQKQIIEYNNVISSESFANWIESDEQRCKFRSVKDFIGTQADISDAEKSIQDDNIVHTSFIAGTSDGILGVVEDFTRLAVQAIKEDYVKSVLELQELNSSIQKNNFISAFVLALKLNHPRHLRQVLVKWISHSSKTLDITKESESQEVVGKMIALEILPKLKKAQIDRLLVFVREWLTNSRYCHIATLILHSFLCCFDFQEIIAIICNDITDNDNQATQKEKTQFGSMNYNNLTNIVNRINSGSTGRAALLEALLSYSGRHIGRIQHTLQQLYFIDYMISKASGNIIYTPRNSSTCALTFEPSYLSCVKRVRDNEDSDNNL